MSGDSKKKPRLYHFTFDDAVMNCHTIGPEMVPLLMVLNALGDGTNGEGISSQARIAKAMKRSERYVRDLIAELDAMPNAPFKIDRERRYKDGYRTSDRYRLVIVDTKLTGTLPAAKVDEAYRHGSRTLPAQEGELTGTQRSEDHICLDHIDQISIPPAAGNPSNDNFKASELEQHYCTEFAKHRGNGKHPRWTKLPRVTKAFAELGTLFGVEDGKRIITNSLADPWVRRIEPWELAADGNKHLTPGPKQKAGPAVQRGGYTERPQNDTERRLAEEAARLEAAG